MSRSLGKDAIASLKSGDPTAAYQQISRAFTTDFPEKGLLDIEILGRSHALEPGTYLLQDGPAVALSKVGLVQAFLVARRILAACLDHKDLESRDDSELIAATSVILLMDAEHLTAANSRKRLLQPRLSDPVERHPALDREKRFVDSLLTSRLHRHTKSPTLWSHRRWLLEMYKPTPEDVLPDITGVVMVSGERHPRNYYAWCHARWLMKFILSDAGGAASSLELLLLSVQDWCFRHHTDISGWSFLYSLLTASGILLESQACSVAFIKTLSLAASLRWANESVWVFLRTLAASGILKEGDLVEFQRTNEQLKAGFPRDSLEWKVLNAADAWYTDYRVQPDASHESSTQDR